jgi:cell division protein FtsI/penicillin-binding protein 2
MRKAIADSCNIYFYAIGGGYKDIPGLGVTRLKKY